MALAASCQACRWNTWTREIDTFVAPAHVVLRDYQSHHPTSKSNAGRSWPCELGFYALSAMAGALFALALIDEMQRFLQ
jgi:hypothetical protein